ncbi:MAG: HNH endonuclease [Planctomycetes bacterium]|nr:HNH endonuclease [Planctomycetota bacterium]
MDSNISRAIKSKSEVNYNYSTVRMTRSRIEKGLIAIPVSLSKWFPQRNTKIKIYLDDSAVLHNKNYSSYASSTRECRIGGMAEWLKENKIKDADEIIVQLVDKENFIYRLIRERMFVEKTHKLQERLDSSRDELEALDRITSLSRWTDLDKQKVMLKEYHRIATTMPVEERQYLEQRSRQARESAPSNLRVLLGNVYRGHCQVCDFWFLKKDSNPYFEIHHIDPLKSNNPKNLVLVCANCHRQFEYANIIHKFNKEDWLIRVSFNKKTYFVNQVLLKEKLEESFKELFI